MAHDSISIIITEIIITIIIYYIQQSELYYVVKKGLDTISLNYFETYWQSSCFHFSSLSYFPLPSFKPRWVCYELVYYMINSKRPTKSYEKF